jgi:hypothetical protein
MFMSNENNIAKKIYKPTKGSMIENFLQPLWKGQMSRSVFVPGRSIRPSLMAASKARPDSTHVDHLSGTPL